MGKRLLKRAIYLYPDIQWAVDIPTPEEKKIWGKGVILRGKRGAELKEYYIVSKTPSYDTWIKLIASQLATVIES